MAEDDFEELDIETGNRLIVVVYDPIDDLVTVENPYSLPAHEVLGLLHVALLQWQDGWADVGDWQEEGTGDE